MIQPSGDSTGPLNHALEHGHELQSSARMSLLNRLRRLGRALPVDPVLMHRLRRSASMGFRLAAWLRHGRSRRPAAPRGGPVCVVGFHGSVLGIGEAARALGEALRLAGAEVSEWDISALFGHEVRLDCKASPEPPASASSLVIFLNPHELVQLVAMTGSRPFAGRFCVGAWFWELEQVPRSWRPAMGYVDEVWAGSRFVAEAVARRAPKGLPIRVLPCPTPAPTAVADRTAFGLLPAQAMAAGKAVEATGWSANLDFMTPDNSVLVDYQLRPVEDSQGLYAGGRWAEADPDDAAAKLRALIGDPERRRVLGQRAAAHIAATLDPATIGRRAVAWLEGRSEAAAP